MVTVARSSRPDEIQSTVCGTVPKRHRRRRVDGKPTAVTVTDSNVVHR